MRNIILGVNAVLWGGALLTSGLTSAGSSGSGAYASGQLAGYVFGFIFLVAGAYFFVKGIKQKKNKEA